MLGGKFAVDDQNRTKHLETQKSKVKSQISFPPCPPPQKKMTNPTNLTKTSSHFLQPLPSLTTLLTATFSPTSTGTNPTGSPRRSSSRASSALTSERLSARRPTSEDHAAKASSGAAGAVRSSLCGRFYAWGPKRRSRKKKKKKHEKTNGFWEDMFLFLN